MNEYKREIKSYVLRSRMTSTQRTGLEKYWPLYGVELGNKQLDLAHLFQRSALTILEIGFGMGDSLIQLAKANPDINFLGIEVHKPGVGALLHAINEIELSNVRVICADAIRVIKDYLLNESLLGVLLFFPDPWTKRRHHKRRIVQPSLVNLINQKLQSDGYFHLATDVEEYATHMLRVVDSHRNFAIINQVSKMQNSLRRPETKFERRGEQLGHIITELVFLKKP